MEKRLICRFSCWKSGKNSLFLYGKMAGTIDFSAAFADNTLK